MHLDHQWVRKAIVDSFHITVYIALIVVYTGSHRLSLNGCLYSRHRANRRKINLKCILSILLYSSTFKYVAKSELSWSFQLVYLIF